MPAQLFSRDELMSEENIYLTNDSRNNHPTTAAEFDAQFKSRRANNTLSPQLGMTTVGSSMSKRQF